MVKPRFIKELRRQDKTEKIFETVVVNPKIASDVTLRKIRKVLENVVVKGTASNIYSSNFSMAGKTGTAKKYLPKHKDENGNTVAAGYSNKHYVASFAGFFPSENPKYSCIVIIHDPKKEKGYYGATVAGPVFKEIAQKIYTTTPVDNQSVEDKVNFEEVERQYLEYDTLLGKSYTEIPDVKGMPGMDAMSLLENIGLKVKISGVGKVEHQSLEKGEKLIKGNTITLKLS
jgi:cell division protein FtsI (penicillin-binding protein 3)